MEKWDPLSSIITSSQEELILAARKREINNILKSYVGFFDPFCEMIQNAMDAVDLRKKELQETNYQKKIWIKIDLKNNSVSVTDNGIGFKEDEFKMFLCPNVSFKDGKVTRGSKGVGATYLAYGFNFLQLGTKTPSFDYIAEIKEGRNWVEDNFGRVTRPFVTKSTLVHTDFNQIDRGSTFTIKFGGNNVRPKDLSWINATNAEQWKNILLIKTPLGKISINGEREKILFDIEVINKNDEVTKITDAEANYVYPHLVVNPSVDLKVILEEQKKMIDKQLDTSKLNDKYKKLTGIYSFFNTDELIEIIPSTEEQVIELIRDYSIKAYGYFCYSTNVWDAFNDSKLKLRKGARILRGGLQLATNNMPQGELITIPLTSNIGYQNQAHIVVLFENAEPDLGRKGFQPELEDTAKRISVSIVNKFKKWRKLLKVDSGAPPSIINQSKLDNWIDNQKEHERQQPLSIKNKNFFSPIEEISITSIPLSEQDVVVLFSQLLAGGVVRGIKLMATSTHQQYDGIFRYFIKKPFENHFFNKTLNPLGVKELTYINDEEEFISKPFVLEYKYNVDALIREFENGEKDEKDVNLVIAWDIGNEWKRKYTITSLLDLDNMHHRHLHGLTHIFKDEKTDEIRFYGIILSELIDYLNDTDGVQEYHKNTYGEYYS